jgi:plastocyanin
LTGDIGLSWQKAIPRPAATVTRGIAGICHIVSRAISMPHPHRSARHHAPGKEITAMTTSQTHVSRRPKWHAALAGGLLSALLLMAPSARAAEPTPVRPAAPPSAATAQPEGQVITLGTLTFSDHGTKDVKGQAELDLEADDYYFAPTFLRGAPGQRLTLEIENESGTLHNLSIPGQRIDQDIPPNGTVKVEVTIPQSGVMHFFCKFHTAIGMNGELLAGDAMPQAVSHSAGR